MPTEKEPVAPATWTTSPWLLPAIVCAHIVLWTAFSTLAQSAGAVHHDMTEAWAWGQQPQLGYYKHPPFYAWIVGLWFHIFPREDVWFYLLAQINSGLGLAGVWFLAGRLVGPAERLAAVLLLSLAPFNNVMAINFNANAILLSLWPWTTYAFVRAVQTGRALDGLLFGALAAAGLLSKYFSALLLAGCLFASLLHPRVRAIYRSPAPYVALVVCVLLLLPHANWVLSHDLQTLQYAADKANKSAFSRSLVLYKTITTGFATLALLGLPALVLGAAVGRAGLAERMSAARRNLRGDVAWIAVLAWTPFILTLLAGVLASVKISTNFMIPVLFMVPLAFLMLSRLAITPPQLRTIRRAAIGYPVAAVLATPVIATVLFARQVDLASEPRQELAARVTAEWHAAFGSPLRIVAGTNAYGTGITFYSPDSPADFTRLNHAQAPWITPERLRREGVAIACIDADQDCRAKAAALMTPAGRRLRIDLRRRFWGSEGPVHAFEVFMIPPGDIPPVREPMLHRN